MTDLGHIVRQKQMNNPYQTKANNEKYPGPWLASMGQEASDHGHTSPVAVEKSIRTGQRSTASNITSLQLLSTISLLLLDFKPAKTNVLFLH